MKKLLAAACAVLLALNSLSACTADKEKARSSVSAGSTVESSKKLSVCTSFYAMYDFTKKIAGDKAVITNLVPAGTEPHDWEPGTRDMIALEKADVLVLNGASMEGWADKVTSALQNKNLVVITASDGVKLLEGHQQTKKKKGKDASKKAEHDPHVWLNPQNAKKEMENIKNALVKADEANKMVYESNYEKYAKELDKLDEEYRTTLRTLKNKNIIVAHEAYGYLCNAYGLNQIGIEGFAADSEPDPAKMAEIIDFAKENNVKIIFFEELVSPKVAEIIAKSVGAKTEVLNPIEGLTDEQLAQGDDYLTVMRKNLSVLKAALEQ